MRPIRILSVLTLITYFSLLAGSLASAKSSNQKSLSGREIIRMEQKLFMMINEERLAKGIQPLILDPKIQLVATMHSKDIARKGNPSPSIRTEPNIVERLNKANIAYRIVGENITSNKGANDPLNAAKESWMNSPEHYNKIISADYNRSGIGIAQGRDGTFYFTQIFIKR